ncbi:hypothetical protein PYCCODRAFT_87837 [Trametes coccinea BRFM310]|uniref:Uncharacterized protein n=1 Tax=Trametes coccinea (strain BRFM310) TaxID=1353009 RepID=A0A1Y2I5G7_TRAC3|nr:hypothetical protein PYCCODRAFT_87837 [Trametes coccinea BRFM310]
MKGYLVLHIDVLSFCLRWHCWHRSEAYRYIFDYACHIAAGSEPLLVLQRQGSIKSSTEATRSPLSEAPPSNRAAVFNQSTLRKSSIGLVSEYAIAANLALLPGNSTAPEQSTQAPIANIRELRKKSSFGAVSSCSPESARSPPQSVSAYTDAFLLNSPGRRNPRRRLYGCLPL